MKGDSLSTMEDTYIAIDFYGHTLRIASSTGEAIESRTPRKIASWLSAEAQHRHEKIIAAMLMGDLPFGTQETLWLDEDIVPITGQDAGAGSEDLAAYAQSLFDTNGVEKILLTEDREVIVTNLLSLKEYISDLNKNDRLKFWYLLHECAGKDIMFINSTPRGGGVALMRHALLRLFKQAGIHAHWHVLTPDTAVFAITKEKIHDVLQNISLHPKALTGEDKELLAAWYRYNADILYERWKNADIIIIDDPQPSGLIPYIKRDNPKAKIIYRSHIQIESGLASQKGTVQYEAWQYIWEQIQSIDCFVSHPIESFIPPLVPKEKVVFMPATTSLHDGLNKKLSVSQSGYYIDLFQSFLQKAGELPLDFSRPYIIQVARFDPSKGFEDAVESFFLLRNKLAEADWQQLPQLVLVGNQAIDDPEESTIFADMQTKINEMRFQQYRNDMKAIQIPHRDQVLNTLMRKASIALQLSYKEGFEIKVTEALMKGIPAIIYNSGGLPLQIEDNWNGFIIQTGDTRAVADCMFTLLTNKKFYMKISTNAKHGWRRDLTTSHNALRWLMLTERLTHGKGTGGCKSPEELF